AFIKLSKWLNNKWHQNGVPYVGPTFDIDYGTNYVIVELPASTNGGAYLVGKEVQPGNVNGNDYSYTSDPTYGTVTIPYTDIFPGAVPVGNGEGLDVGILAEWQFHTGYPGTLLYTSVFWQSMPIVNIASSAATQVDGIWFKGEPNTIIKKTSGMHLGYWDKDGEPFPSPNNLPVQNQIWYGIGGQLFENYYYQNGYWGLQQSGGHHFFVIDNANNIKFTDIEIDGNKQTAVLGGVHPTESIQSGSIGIYFADTKKITLENMNIHHTSFDGILVVDDNNLLTDTKLDCKNTKLNFNGRTAFAWISGKGMTFDNVEFNYAGKEDEFTSSAYGNPNCGIDFEPDLGTQNCGYGTFTNCKFIGNSGLAISANTNSSLVDHMTFDNCTMWDGDSYGIICRAKYVTYNDCNLFCNILNFGSWGTAAATKFNRCNFEDKNNPLNPTQAWPAYNFQSGTERPFNYLLQTVDGSPDQQSTGTTFTDCHFKVNGANREMFRIYTKYIADPNTPTPSSEYTTFDGCDFTYNNDGNTTNPNTNNYSSVLRGILFKGNNIIRNTIQSATSKHEWEMAAVEIEGSQNPCQPFKFDVDGNMMLSQTGWDPNVLLFGRNGNSNNFTGYLKATFKNNSILRFANNVSDPAACNITIGENSTVEFEPTSSIYTRGDEDSYTGGYIFNLLGQIILRENSYFTFFDFKFNPLLASPPPKSLIYIDDQAIGDLPS
ncbi:MAG TPA: right-handed parallel beta-helix repeat-containing protein, partial [Chitinophagaceae bacterium]|nr:right-handed parallel beta-helix repeat-containing protein [Chitinophagaceae bacterium]